MSAIRTLKGITWNHMRGFTPVVASAQRFHELYPHADVHWQKRSLQEFADKPLAQLAAEYDLLVIDHPWAGFAAASGILTDLGTLLAPEFLADQAANSVGQSHPSYNFDGKQWGLAIDAACPVSAYRPDLLDQHGADVPRTFDELVALADRGLVCCPSIALDVYGNFLNLLTAAGETIFPNEDEVAERDAALTALERLKNARRSGAGRILRPQPDPHPRIHVAQRRVCLRAMDIRLFELLAPGLCSIPAQVWRT